MYPIITADNIPPRNDTDSSRIPLATTNDDDLFGDDDDSPITTNTDDLHQVAADSRIPTKIADDFGNKLTASTSNVGHRTRRKAAIIGETKRKLAN